MPMQRNISSRGSTGMLSHLHRYADLVSLRARVSGYLRRRADARLGALASAELAHCPVVVYFGNQVVDFYQLEQWIPVFDRMPQSCVPTYVFRDQGAYRYFKSRWPGDAVCLPYLNTLQTYFESARPNVVLYVNNAVNNFQSLIYSAGIHIHLNHGESDKVCMETNQVKAYDLALVCGPKAIERYQRSIRQVDVSRLIPIGRPQQDVIQEADLPEAGCRKVIVYAPTWEGDRDVMAYSSVAKMGQKIVQALLCKDQYYVVYKPHPKLGCRDVQTLREHRKIISVIQAARNGRVFEGDVLGMLKRADALISDVSSVVVDFLQTGKPYWVYLPESMSELDKLDSVAAGYTYSSDWEEIANDIEQGLSLDVNKAIRDQVRKAYFGQSGSQGSLDVFIQTIQAAVHQVEQERLSQSTADDVTP